MCDVKLCDPGRTRECRGDQECGPNLPPTPTFFHQCAGYRAGALTLPDGQDCTFSSSLGEAGAGFGPSTGCIESDAFTCLPIGQTCGGTPVGCDEGADCPSGQRRCHYGDEIRCGDDCDGAGSGGSPEHQLCNRGADECASGSCQTAETAGIPSNLHECR